jgi:hypothetical protein
LLSHRNERASSKTLEQDTLQKDSRSSAGMRNSEEPRPENALRPMSAIRDESPDPINLNHLPPFVFNPLADRGKEFLQDSANAIGALQNGLSILVGVRQILAIDDRLQSVADMMVQLRNLPEIIQHLAPPFTRGKQEQERSECRRNTHKRGADNCLHTRRSLSLHNNGVNYEFQ